MSGLDLDALRCEVEALQAERDTARVEAGRLRESLRVLTREHDALITRLRAAEARTAWQPIETAPLGVWVLARYADPLRPPVVVERATPERERRVGGRYLASDGTPRYPLVEWALLPAAPEAP